MMTANELQIVWRAMRDVSLQRRSAPDQGIREGLMMYDIRAEHYSTQDRLLLITAGDALVGWAHDIATHEANGHRWDRSPDDDAVLMAAQLGWLLTATTTTLEQAMAWYTRATDNARRRAADQSQR